MDIVRVRNTYHVKIGRTSLILSIALITLSVAIASALVSRAAIMEAVTANVENRAELREAKRLAADVSERCQLTRHMDLPSGP